MKKIVSGILTASMIATSLGILPADLSLKAAADDQTMSVTDINKYTNNDIIVVYKKEKNATRKKTLSICGLSNSTTADTEVAELTDNSVVLKLDSKEDLSTAIENLSRDSSVEYIQPNYIYKLYAADVNTIYQTLSSNPYFNKQWAYYNDGSTSYSEKNSTSIWGRPSSSTVQATSGVDIKMLEAWNSCATSKRETVVAIVDTGIMYDHDDLKDHMWKNPGEIAGDGKDNDGNGYIDDVYGWNFYDESVYDNSYSNWWFGKQTPTPSPTENPGNNTYYNKNSSIEDSHGTHGAGTIVASNNSIGTVGIASNANVKLMSVKALGGDEGYGSTESVVQGILYAEENGAHICNLSLGGDEDDAILRDAIKDSPMLFTIAAGNGNPYSGQAINIDRSATYPASYDFDNIITVANLQCNGTLHSTSNYGAKSVDLAAPGSYIYSTSTYSEVENNTSSAISGYEYMSGTSMAAPMVAGVAAMLYSCYDDLSVLDVKNIIMNSVTPMDSLKNKCLSGGNLNAYEAIKLANEGKISIATPSPTASAKPSNSPFTSATPKISTPPITSTQPTMEAGVTSPPSISPTNGNTTPTPSSFPWPWLKTSSPVPTTTSSVAPTSSSIPEQTSTVTATPTPTNSSWFPWPWNSKVPASTTTPAPTTATPSAIPTSTPTLLPSSTPSITGIPTTNTPVIEPSSTPVTMPTLAPISTITPTTPVQTTPSPEYDFVRFKSVNITGKGTYKIGIKYTITPKAIGGDGKYQYRYLISKNGKTYFEKDYTSTQTSVNWKPSAAGDYQLKISVKDSNGYNDYYSICLHVDKMKIKSLKANKALKKGVTVKYTAKADSGYGTLTYKFTLKKVNSNYKRTKNSKSTVFSWKIPSKGTYKLTVSIKDTKKNSVSKTYTIKVK